MKDIVLRPEWIVHFYSVEDNRELKKKPDLLDDSFPDFEYQHFSWSFERGYVIKTYDKIEDDIDGHVINVIPNYNHFKLRYPDATLARLSKATGYDYLKDGRYTMRTVRWNAHYSILIPIHLMQLLLKTNPKSQIKSCIDGVLTFKDENKKIFIKSRDVFELLGVPKLDLSYIFGMIFTKGVPQGRTDVCIKFCED